MALSVASGAPCVTSAAFRHMRYRDGTSDSELQDRVGELRGESRLAISLLHGTAHLLDILAPSAGRPSGQSDELIVRPSGSSVRSLYDPMPAGADPLGREAIHGLTTGPLTGTRSIMGNRFTVVEMLPKTGACRDANRVNDDVKLTPPRRIVTDPLSRPASWRCRPSSCLSGDSSRP
jgi:hypothetical protein